MLLSKSTRPSKLRAEAPESRDERSASSIKLSGRHEMMTISASRRTAGGMTSNNSASPPSLAGLIMASCSRSSCKSLTEAGPCRTPGAGPVQPSTSRRPWCRQVSRQSVAANEIACSRASRCSGEALVRGSQGSIRIARSCSFCCSNSLTISSPRRADVRQ